MRRLLLSPSWIARHLLALFLIALFLRMGVWQFTKGESAQGSLQNLFYGVEWPIFAIFVLYWWVKMMKEDLAPKDLSGPQWGVGGRIAPEASWQSELALGPRMLSAGTDSGASAALALTGPDAEPDEELDAYNRYLAALYEHDIDRETYGAR